ncbi:MAG: hypothetical protein C5B54_10480 [Acidobacteria bacterium]|nr:MAG: hypothetical protein C5B54_10480 [Acidobacteriota bacterium]
MAVDNVQGPGGGFKILDGDNKASVDDASGNFDDLINKSGSLMQGDSAYFLKLQEQMAMETRAFETISKVLESRDQAAKMAIQAIRG